MDFTAWTLAFVIIQSILSVGETTFNSHRTNGISQIPWNMLLDPNYTSHKLTPSSNKTSFMPSYDEYFPSALFQHQKGSVSLNKNAANNGIYYVQKPTTQTPSHNHAIKYSPQFVDKDNRQNTYSSSSPVSHRPEKIMFPAATSFQVSKPELSQPYTPSSHQKNIKTTPVLKEKQKKRKPADYFTADDDYFDSYYQDYDYPESDQMYSKTPKERWNKEKESEDPLGLLPSATDPDGFFAKAKDILRGSSYNKPSYSPSGSSYSTTNQQYGEYEPHGGHSYYDTPVYPPKESYYGQPGYEYDTPYGSGHYGDIVTYAGKRKGSKYGSLAFALGLLPLGLLIASLVPTVVTIPVTTAVATGKRRKRSAQLVNPVLETISEYGVKALEDPSCLNRIFCQVVRDGNQERSSVVQKLYLKIANVLDEKIASYIGLWPLVSAVRRNECHIFQCPANIKSAVSEKDQL